MNSLTIPLLLFSFAAHAVIGDNKSTESSEDDPNWLCFPNDANLSKINDLLDPTDEGLERLVVYIYKKVGTHDIKLYIPGLSKQARIPDLPYENTDEIVVTATENLANIFKHNPSKIKVNKNSIDILPSHSPIGLYSGSIEHLYPEHVTSAPDVTEENVQIVTKKPKVKTDENGIGDIQQTSTFAPITKDSTAKGIVPLFEFVSPTPAPVIATRESEIGLPEKNKNLIDSFNTLITFETWFEHQMHNFQGLNLPYDISTINKKVVQYLVQNTLAKHNIIINADGLIQDANGKVIDSALLELRPFLIGEKVPYQILQNSPNTITFPKDLPYLEGILVIRDYPYQILGIIPLGKSYLTQSSPLHDALVPIIHTPNEGKDSVNKHRFINSRTSNPYSIYSISNDNNGPIHHTATGETDYNHITDSGKYNSNNEIAGTSLNPSYYYPTSDAYSGSYYQPYLNYYYNNQLTDSKTCSYCNLQYASYPTADTVYNQESFSHPNVDNVPVQYPTTYNVPQQKAYAIESHPDSYSVDNINTVPYPGTYSVNTVNTESYPGTYSTDTVNIVPYPSTNTVNTINTVPYPGTYTVDTVNTVPHPGSYIIDTVNTVPYPGTYTVDTVNTVPYPGTYTVDTVNTVPHSGSYTTDTVNTVPYPGTYTVDTVNTVPYPDTYTVDTVNTVPYPGTYTVDTVNTVPYPDTYTVDTVNTVPYPGTYTIDTVNTVPYPGTYTVDTVNTVPHSGSYTIDTVKSVPIKNSYSVKTVKTTTHPSSYSVETVNTVPKKGSKTVTTVNTVPIKNSYSVKTVKTTTHPSSYSVETVNTVPNKGSNTVTTVNTVPNKNSYSVKTVKTTTHPSSYSVETVNTVPNQGSNTVDTVNTVPHTSSYSVQTVSTVPNKGTYTGHTVNTVPQTSSYSVDTVNAVLHPSSYSVKTVKTVTHPRTYQYQISQKPSSTAYYKTGVNNVYYLPNSYQSVDNVPVDNVPIISHQTVNQIPLYTTPQLVPLEGRSSAVKIEHHIGVPKKVKKGGVTNVDESDLDDNPIVKSVIKHIKNSHHNSLDTYGIDDIVNDSENANDGGGPDFRIIGGSAATGSGTPLSNKGRSGYEEFI